MLGWNSAGAGRGYADDGDIAQTQVRAQAHPIKLYTLTLKDRQLKLREPFVEMVAERVGLEQDIAEVGQQDERRWIVGGGPLFIEKVAKD